MIELDSRLRSLIAGWGRALQSHRTVFLGIGVLLFAIGLVVSFRALGSSGYEADFGLLLFNAILLTPIALLLNAWGLRLSGRIVNADVSIRTALTVSSASTVAEILPIPAGLMARTAALVAGGANVVSAGSVLAAAAFLWVGLCGLIGAFALLNAGSSLGALIMVGSGVMSLAGSVWILRRGGPKGLLLLWFHRLLSLLVVVARIFVTYRGLGGVISPADAALVSSAYVVGSLSTILPAGLGIGEGLSAVAAHTVGINPALAFTATAVNRLLTFIAAGIFALPAFRAGREPGRA